ncbi:MAG TPA: LPS assembly protein LptD [Opitutaceae bacterium]
MTRSLALALTAAAILAGPARAAGPSADLSADSAISLDYATGDLVATPNAKLVDTGIILAADEIRFNQKTQVAVATGHVTLTREQDRILADRLTYDAANGRFSAVNLRVGRFPYYIAGASAEGTRTEVTIHDATITYREPSKWQPTLHASTLMYSAGHYLRLAGGDVGVGNFHPIPLSRIGQQLNRRSSLTDTSVGAGYRHNLGPWVDLAQHIPIADGITAGPDLGIYAFRGVMLGPTAAYNFASGYNTMEGLLKSGYIYDLGTRYTDILNNPVPPSRSYLEWVHNEQITDAFTLTGDVNYSSDSEVVRDFHSKDFIPVQEPDNYFEAVYTGTNYFASAFTRFQPDAFYPVQQRLPEIRYDLVPTEVPLGIYIRFDAGVAHLEEVPPDGGSFLEDDRFDTFFGAMRPFTYKNIVDFTPVVGGRFTDYWSTEGAAEAGGASRAVGELGFDADMKMNAVFDYRNEAWGIDGLRHLITPTFSYRYIPDADKDAAYIPPIDRSTFTSYMPILDLGDMRAIDQLQAENVLRLGINNTLQTRDETYGSRDVMTFNADEDFRFTRAPGQTDFSDVYLQMTASPAHWLEFRVEDTISTARAAQRAMDSTVTFRQGDFWSIGLGVGYLSDKYGEFLVPGLGYNPIVGVDTFHYEARMRMNEVYTVFVRGDYDARDSLFVDMYYGVDQRISNTWNLEYAVVFSQGPNNHMGHFGIEMNLDVIRF